MKLATGGFVLAATVIAGACEQPSPLGPTPLPRTDPQQPQDFALTVVDGWDGAPVWYSTFLRALVYGALNRYNPRPGLLNRDDPAAELSQFERRALKMVSLRTPGHLWPDRDKGR